MSHHYRNIYVSHPQIVQSIFKKFINDFDTIIEIGTYAGGLALWMNDNSKALVITCDIIDPSSLPKGIGSNEIHNMFANENILFYLRDCFKEADAIKTQIENGGKCLLLCDGGNKIKEMKTFCKYLKDGDVIMCHDFSENDNDFKKWASEYDWKYAPEIRTGDIQDTLSANNLVQYNYYNDLKQVFWGSWTKNVGSGDF